MSRCAQCGRPTSDHERHVRFRLPDPVLGSELQERAPGAWQDGPDPDRSALLSLPELGSFVRALLPVALEGGSTVTFGVWVAVRGADLRRAFDVWWQPAYASLRLEGHLANHVAPWQVLGAPVGLAVRDPDHTPVCVRSEHPGLHAVLTTRWPHEPVLGVLPG